MTPHPDRDDARSLGDLGRGVCRLVSLPSYFVACAVALGAVGVVAASSGSAGLALFCVVHMLLALAAAGWRGHELGLIPAEPPRRADPPPATATPPLPTGVESARA